MKKYFYSIGLMSGTSIDGIDVSLIKSDGEGNIQVIDNIYQKYNNKFRNKIKKNIDLCYSKYQFIKLSREIKAIENDITRKHAKACNLIKRKNKNINIDLIGFHGQTILHKPKKNYSIQIGDPKLLSKLTKITVVSNFRNNDILNGGQGAPLTPLYHNLILSNIIKKIPSAIINIGGIANITYLEKKNKIISFDTGPGNYLLDSWVKKKSKAIFDKNGKFSKKGKLDKKVLEKFLINPYYKKKPPKSLDVKDFNLNNLENLNLEDGCATLSTLTIKSIANAIKSLKKPPKIILFSGGGRKNKFIINGLKNLLKQPIYLIDKFNLNGDFIESQAFAYLAIRSYLKKIITLPTTTGVRKPCSGGIITNY